MGRVHKINTQRDFEVGDLDMNDAENIFLLITTPPFIVQLGLGQMQP